MMARRQQNATPQPPDPLEGTAAANPGPVLDPQETAAYIADVALGLRSLARRAELPFLAYLLEMVVSEALQRGELR